MRGESLPLKPDIYRRLADSFRFYLHLLPLRGAFGTREQRQRPRCQTLLLPEDEKKQQNNRHIKCNTFFATRKLAKEHLLKSSDVSEIHLNAHKSQYSKNPHTRTPIFGVQADWVLIYRVF